MQRRTLAHLGIAAAAIGSGAVIALIYTVSLQATYYLTILRATSETKLEKARS